MKTAGIRFQKAGGTECPSGKAAAGRGRGRGRGFGVPYCFSSGGLTLSPKNRKISYEARCPFLKQHAASLFGYAPGSPEARKPGSPEARKPHPYRASFAGDLSVYFFPPLACNDSFPKNRPASIPVFCPRQNFSSGGKSWRF